jgi:DNA-binding transcriptional ArsR family regulator
MISCYPDMNSIVLASTETTAAARFFRVLGDPTRLRIVEALTERERTVGELVELIGQAQPRISTHLACLRHCGFVTTERRGKEIVYRLALKGLGKLLNQAIESQSPIAEQLATCTRIGPDWV